MGGEHTCSSGGKELGLSPIIWCLDGNGLSAYAEGLKYVADELVDLVSDARVDGTCVQALEMRPRLEGTTSTYSASQRCGSSM